MNKNPFQKKVLSFNEQGQYDIKIENFDSFQAQNLPQNCIILDEILNDDQSMIIYNWPPLVNQNIYTQLKDCSSQNLNSVILNQIDQYVDSSIQKFQQKMNEFRLNTKKKIMNTFSIKVQNIYATQSSKNDLKKYFEDEKLNKNLIQILLQSQVQKKKENTEIFEKVIQDCFNEQKKVLNSLENILEKSFIDIFELGLNKQELDSQINLQNSNLSQKFAQLDLFLQKQLKDEEVIKNKINEFISNCNRSLHQLSDKLNGYNWNSLQDIIDGISSSSRDPESYEFKEGNKGWWVIFTRRKEYEGYDVYVYEYFNHDSQKSTFGTQQNQVSSNYNQIQQAKNLFQYISQGAKQLQNEWNQYKKQYQL
ncbi:hypothetical protein TTHERM_00047390 (macronuclear) [Tetrahymena thermophila SB210]|uniref:Uncharacterized protein n=1 Tax=Tetrahymena thermophila (strain SB210) TaxID=312017 RepID=Q23DF2_TETTS|nr:hypothetical protein TTHERM_00047390 [Tetrahymena thermophila SB210]EAR94552.2 hypothetical protein TTHERM_00047390 [Tetrahymena thermophila SB210]|eukprot:XP_001014734.2 hypothetical protein TTHERM_00047390 [Tetrahymena thermophila SB210]